MTAPIQEPNLYRHASGLQWGQNQLFRRPAPRSDYLPITFRAALQEIADPEADRPHYTSGGGQDLVSFDTWDTTFNTDVYDISDWEFIDPLTGYDSISGVSLIAPGIYSMTAQVDVAQYWSGATMFASNFDDGTSVYHEHGTYPIAGVPFIGDSTIRFDMNRFVWTTDDDEEWDTESDFEVVFAQNNDADLVVFTGLPGVWDGSGTDPSDVIPGSDLWIPGGTDGFLGPVSYVLICYWGLPEWDTDWPGSFPPFGMET
jgi:hypothetical protein